MHNISAVRQVGEDASHAADLRENRENLFPVTVRLVAFALASAVPRTQFGKTDRYLSQLALSQQTSMTDRQSGPQDTLMLC